MQAAKNHALIMCYYLLNKSTDAFSQKDLKLIHKCKVTSELHDAFQDSFFELTHSLDLPQRIQNDLKEDWDLIRARILNREKSKQKSVNYRDLLVELNSTVTKENVIAMYFFNSNMTVGQHTQAILPMLLASHTPFEASDLQCFHSHLKVDQSAFLLMKSHIKNSLEQAQVDS